MDVLSKIKQVFGGSGAGTPGEVATSGSVDEQVAAASLATARRARMSGFGEPQNLSVTLDVQRIQNALRAAERGDTWLYFTIVRDMIAGYAHLQAEWAKRKMVIIGQPQSLLPHDKDDKDDQIACEVIQEMIDGCRNWYDGISHLLDATLYPLSVVEKIYEPVGLVGGSRRRWPVRFALKELAPVPYTLLCFKVPYLASGLGGRDGALRFDADQWENWLRFYETEPTGNVNWSTMKVYEPDAARHLIHRGNILSPSIPPNFGGHIRAILFWWFFATQDRDFWMLMMQKYGMPLIVGKVDAQQKDTVAAMQAAFALATQLGGLVIDKKAEVELQQTNMTDGSNSHKIFQDFANCEVSKLVVGQVLSASPKSTGLGSGMADQAEGVREDFRQWDTTKMANTLQSQLFEQYLTVNGYRGRPPKISWGGKRDDQAERFSKTLNQLAAGGYELTDEALPTASAKLGYGIQRRKLVETTGAKPGGSNDD